MDQLTTTRKYSLRFRSVVFTQLITVLLVGLLPSLRSSAQIPNCSSDVPFYNYDFTGNPTGVFSTPTGISRKGNCCGTSSPDRCLHFQFKLDTLDVAISFAITSGAVPPGALFYQIDCGPQLQYGTPGCVTGTGIHHLTFCKPGNNVNTYSFFAIPKPTAPKKDTVRIGCSKNITTYGYDTASVTWTSIFPGATGAYNSYLSCTSNCTNPLFTPAAVSPAFIDYKICGGPYANNCGLPASTCDTVRVYVYPPLAVSISPSPATFCITSTGVTLTSTVTGGFGAYQYTWKKGAVTMGTASTLFATTAGTYTLFVTDALFSCPVTSASVVVSIANITLTPSHTNVSCFGGNNGTATIAATGGTPPYTYTWNPNVGSTASVSGLTAGTYRVTVTDVSGCNKTDSMIVTQPTAIAPVITSQTNVVCNGQSTGAIDISVSGGTPPYTYHWSSGQTTQDLTAIPAGTYVDTVFDANGCKATISVTITQPGAIVPFPGSGLVNVMTNVSCNGLCDATANVSFVGGTAPYSYLWSPNSDTTISVTGLCAGIISVTITDANGCTALASDTITQPLTLTDTIYADSVYAGGYNITCYGSSNGFATVSPGGGTTPYSYSWSNSDTTQRISNVPAGHYVVTITDANGCVKQDSIDIIQPDSLKAPVSSPVTAGGFNIACKGESSGIMDVNISDGTPPYIIVWSTGDSNVTHLSHLFAGFYSVTVTDANGCNGMDTITLTEPDTVVPLITVTIVAGLTNISCFGGNNASAQVTVTGGSPPYSYYWSNGDIINTTDSVAATDSLSAGIVSVLVVDTNGCSGDNDYNVTQPPLLLSSIVTSDYNGSSVTCFGAGDGYAVVTITGGSYPFGVIWSDTTASHLQTLQPDSSVTDSIFNIMAGHYDVTITDTNGCVATNSTDLSEPVLLVVNPLAGLAPSGDNISCNGGSDGSITTTPTGGTVPYTYAWSTTDTTSFISGVTAGPYSVTVTDLNGCSASDSLTLTEPPVLVVDSLFSPTYPGGWNVSCNGGDNGNIYGFESGGVSPYTFYWSNGDTTDYTLNVSVFTYTLTVTDINGCTASDSITLTEPPPIVSTVFALVPVGCYSDSTGSITITTTGGTPSYQYSIDGITFTSSNTFSGLPAGTYIIYTADTNGCADSIMVTITQPDTALTTSQLTKTDVDCNGNLTGSLTVTTAGGTRPYLFSIDNGTTTQSDSTFSGLAAGSYTVLVIDSNNCTASVGITITEPLVLTSGILVQTNVDCFGNATGSVTVTTSGGTRPYSFSINGITFQSDSTFTSLIAGSYTVTVKDTNNCIDTVGVIISEPSASLNATIFAQTNVNCFGNATGDVTVNATGGTPPYLYSIDCVTYQSSPTFSNLLAGAYTICVTDTNNCSTNVADTITEPATGLSASILSYTNVDCNGNFTGSLTVAAIGGTLPYLFSLDGIIFQSDSTFSGLPAGNYTVTIKDSTDSCTASVSKLISEPLSPLSASIGSQTNVDCFGNATGNFTITALGGTAPYQYSIVTGVYQSSNSFSSLAAGPYTITVKDTNGCSTTFQDTILQPSNPLNAAATGRVNVRCRGASTGSFSVSAVGGTPAYQYSFNGGPFGAVNLFTGLPAGSDTVTVRDANNCTRQLIVVVSEPATSISAMPGHTDVSCNAGSNGSVFANPTGGTPPYSYSWNSTWFTQSVTGLIANTYVGTITDSLGCITTVTQTVLEPTVIAPSMTATQPLCNGNSNGSLAESPSGGTPPYTYSWNPTSQTTATATGLAIGFYTVTITDSLGCVKTDTMTLDQPTLLTTTTTFTQASCNGSADGTATTNPSGGTPAYTYSWSPSGGTGQTASNLNAGTYTVTIRDANNCTKNDAVTVTQPTALVADAGQNQIVCGDSAVMSATLATGITGVWSTTGTGTGTFTTPSSEVSPVTGLSVGNNTFQWSITDGTCFGQATVTILSDATVRADAGPDADTCSNLTSQVVLDATPPSIGTGSWSVISGGGHVNNPAQYNSVFLPSAQINLVQWQVTNGVCIDRDTVIVNYKQTGDCFELDLPTAFSPNGDTRNDAYVIHGIEIYPQNKFIVFNRWGNEVYSINNYKNNGPDDADWKGQNNSGDELPDGTYYIILTITNSSLSKNTYVDLRR